MQGPLMPAALLQSPAAQHRPPAQGNTTHQQLNRPTAAASHALTQSTESCNAGTAWEDGHVGRVNGFPSTCLADPLAHLLVCV